MEYMIIVEGIGVVLQGENEEEATSMFNDEVSLSEKEPTIGRRVNVYLFQSGRLVRCFQPF